MTDETVDARVQASRQALSFGGNAGGYAALRPDWPEATARWLLGAPGHVVRRVLDLGAGTGKLTRTLVPLVDEVVAVEPDPLMLQQLRREVPSAVALPGTAESIPLEDGAVDAVTVAQAWHWFDHERAAAECARVLRPGGVLALAWHLRDARVPWVAELADAVGRTGDTVGQPHSDPVDLPEPFGAVESAVFAYELRTTPDGLAALADTWSYVRLSPRRAALLDDVLALGRRAAAPDGTLVVPHVTRCCRAVRVR